MRCAASQRRLGQDGEWWRRLGRVTGHLRPAAAVPPAVEPGCTGWIRVPSRSRRARHAFEPMRHWKARLEDCLQVCWVATAHYRCRCAARHTAPVISRELATRLAPYLSWTPANGDMFFIPRPEIAESVFIVSDMVVELVVAGGESRFHFNGTVEWALDSVESDGVVWLPREDQLREMLGEYFLSLDSSAGGFVVTVSGPSKAYHTAAEPDAADAYARAALYVLGVAQSSIVS